MAFDLKKLAEESVDLAPALEASLYGKVPMIPITPEQLVEMYPEPRAIPINPPGPSAHAADLEAAIAQCRAATERAERLLATLRGAQ